MRVRYIPLSGVLFFALLLLAHGILVGNPLLFAQTGSITIPAEKVGVKVTFPKANSTVPVGSLEVNGTSSDTSQIDCRVYIDWNDLKPMQNVTAAGANGTNDYSKWIFTFTQNYSLITEGTNELTSKIVCVNDLSGNTTTKFYSINVTGINTNSSLTSSIAPAGLNQTNHESNGFQTVTYQGVLPQYNGGTNTKSDISDEKENDDSDKQDTNPASAYAGDEHELDSPVLVTADADSSEVSDGIEVLDTSEEDTVEPNKLVPKVETAETDITKTDMSEKDTTETDTTETDNIEVNDDVDESEGAVDAIEDTVEPNELAPEVESSEVKTSEVATAEVDTTEINTDEVNTVGADKAHTSDGTKAGQTAEVGDSAELSYDGEITPSHLSDETEEIDPTKIGVTHANDGAEIDGSEVDTPEVNDDVDAGDDANLGYDSGVDIDEVHIAEVDAREASEDTEVDTAPTTDEDADSFIDKIPSENIEVEGETSDSNEGNTPEAISEFLNTVKDMMQEDNIEDGQVLDTQPVNLKATDDENANKDRKADAKKKNEDKDLKPIKPKKVQKKKIPTPEFYNKDPFRPT
jgi:hypothetical protein